jgi:hypothetical protein
VCLCRYNAMLVRAVAGFFVKASDIAIKHGLTRPSADVSDLDYNAWNLRLLEWIACRFRAARLDRLISGRICLEHGLTL